MQWRARAGRRFSLAAVKRHSFLAKQRISQCDAFRRAAHADLAMRVPGQDLRMREVSPVASDYDGTMYVRSAASLAANPEALAASLE
jgi:hypothetical protein